MLALLPFIALLAIAPAAYAWWSGRTIVRSLDDPALPELLLARQRRLVQVTLVAIIASAMLEAPTGFSIVVLLLVLLAQYPIRRAVYGDSWSRWQYVRFTSFSAIAFGGLWLYPLIAAGIVAQLAREWIPTPSARQTLLGGALGVVAAIVYLIWQRHFTRAWLALHQATPIVEGSAHAALLPRFAAILDRAGDRLPSRPTVHRYGMTGGNIVNAVALCSLHARGVAMSDTLLARLDADEAAAVFAHEIAHHEHYSDALLRKRRRLAVLVAVLVAVIPPLQLVSGSQYAILIDVAFLVVVLAVFARGHSGHRAHETAADLRAVELTGDADAVIRALTKIHALSRLPRRFSQEFERAATHPSLARRIQAIRAHPAASSPSESAEPSAGAVTVVATGTPGTYVALDDVRSHWFEGVPADTPLELAALRDRAASYRALRYGELTELRLAPERPRALWAADLAGRSWSVTIGDDDVAELQRALDRVDAKLGVAPTEAVATSRNTARTLASVLLLATMIGGMWGLPMLVAAAAVFAPTATTLIAAAVLASARALLALGGGDVDGGYAAIALVAVVLLSIWCAWIAWRWSRAPRAEPRAAALWTRALLASLVLGALLAGMGVGVSSAAELLGDPALASASALVLALGAALITLRRSAWRTTGAATTTLAVAGILVGTVGHRLAPASVIEWTTGTLVPVATVPVGRDVHEVALSRQGTRFLTRRFREDDGDDGDYAAEFVTGSIPASGATRALTALDAALASESELLVLDRVSDDSLELRLERADADSAARVVWRRILPGLSAPRLQLAPRGEGWRVSGLAKEDRLPHRVTLSGGIDGASFAQRDVAGDSTYAQTLHVYRDGTTLVATMKSFRRDGSLVELPSALRTYLWALRGAPAAWTLSRVGGDGVRTLVRLRGYPSCSGMSDDDAVCVEQGRGPARLWRVAPDGGVVALGRLPARYERATVSASGYVVGSSIRARSLAIVDAAHRRGVTASLPAREYTYVREVSATEGGVAVVLAGNGGMRIELYRLERATGSTTPAGR